MSIAKWPLACYNVPWSQARFGSGSSGPKRRCSFTIRQSIFSPGPWQRYRARGSRKGAKDTTYGDNFPRLCHLCVFAPLREIPNQSVFKRRRAQVEHVPLKTYKVALFDQLASAIRQTGYRLVERRKFRTGLRGVRRAEWRVVSGEWRGRAREGGSVRFSARTGNAEQ
jgi:hypothetical protein